MLCSRVSIFSKVVLTVCCSKIHSPATSSKNKMANQVRFTFFSPFTAKTVPLSSMVTTSCSPGRRLSFCSALAMAAVSALRVAEIFRHNVAVGDYGYGKAVVRRRYAQLFGGHRAFLRTQPHGQAAVGLYHRFLHGGQIKYILWLRASIKSSAVKRRRRICF